MKSLGFESYATEFFLHKINHLDDLEHHRSVLVWVRKEGEEVFKVTVLGCYLLKPVL